MGGGGDKLCLTAAALLHREQHAPGEKPGEDSIRDVYGNAGQILYMHGESVMVTGINEQQKLISMRNEQNTEGYEAFEIPFFQFIKDFGMWPPEDI